MLRSYVCNYGGLDIVWWFVPASLPSLCVNKNEVAFCFAVRNNGLMPPLNRTPTYQADIATASEKVIARVRQQRSTATEESLIAAARKLFADSGYYATGTNELATLINASRGALYHHFGGKKNLFEAVLRQITAELADTASQAAMQFSGDPWRQLTFALKAYMELIASSKEAQRILLTDGPAVLGSEQWRLIRSEYTLQPLIITFNMLMKRGIIARQPTEPLAQLILAAMNEAAISIAHAAVPEAEQKKLTAALLSLVQALRIK
jgi:AcrR family transcriptional regulator